MFLSGLLGSYKLLGASIYFGKLFSIWHHIGGNSCFNVKGASFRQSKGERKEPLLASLLPRGSRTLLSWE